MCIQGINMCAHIFTQTLTCTRTFLLRSHAFVHRSLPTFLKVHYSVISLSFKFHKDLIFHCRDICKIKCVFLATTVYGSNQSYPNRSRTCLHSGCFILYIVFMDNLNNVGDWRLLKLPEEELLYISHSSMKPIFEDGKNNILSIKMYQHLE